MQNPIALDRPPAACHIVLAGCTSQSRVRTRALELEICMRMLKKEEEEERLCRIGAQNSVLARAPPFGARDDCDDSPSINIGPI